MDDDHGGMAGFDWKTARYEADEQEVKRLRRLVARALDLCAGVAEQQAWPDDSWRAEAAAIRAESGATEDGSALGPRPPEPGRIMSEEASRLAIEALRGASLVMRGEALPLKRAAIEQAEAAIEVLRSASSLTRGESAATKDQAALGPKAPRWWHCDTHGPGALNAWGCPDCVRELRSEVRELRARRALAFEAHPNIDADIEALGDGRGT